ncbi:hypothetical protein B1B_07342 [mine drainage metagenome]|uniref:Spermatogenesis-associated protein 20-like TRX domain-containing protein n=1 Tax=mine drainage metagenome TaxID=410659 RepID=T1ANT6_9ZZZZ
MPCDGRRDLLGSRGAEILAREYVAVKVDRDERPEIDRRYQQEVGALTGEGGWPLTAFLDADGAAFFGGTVLPAHGRPRTAGV